MGKANSERDPEVRAMEIITGALKGLDEEQRDRVTAWVRDRFGPKITTGVSAGVVGELKPA